MKEVGRGLFCYVFKSVIYLFLAGYSEEIQPLEGNSCRGLWKESCWYMIREVCCGDKVESCFDICYPILKRLVWIIMKRQCMLRSLETWTM